MSNYLISGDVFKELNNQLEYLKNNKRDIVDAKYRKPCKDREKLIEVIEKYIEMISKVINNSNNLTEESKGSPFVTVNSEVEVEDMDDNEICKFRIVDPNQNKIGNSQVSFLSPVGMALLMKKIGEEIDVQTPGGICRYRIKSVKIIA
ncbi:MAG: GreA/GreB family elongation factor [Eubacteriales bacterium]